MIHSIKFPAGGETFSAYEDKEDESREMAPEALCFQFLWGWAERGERGRGSKTGIMRKKAEYEHFIPLALFQPVYRLLSIMMLLPD